MPQLLGKLPSYRQHKPTGQAVVTLGGRDYYLGPWKSAASKAEYQRVTRKWLASGGAKPAPDCQGDLTIVELSATFKRHGQQHYRMPDGRIGREYKVYITLLQRLAKLYGKSLASEFGPLTELCITNDWIASMRTRMHETNRQCGATGSAPSSSRGSPTGREE